MTQASNKVRRSVLALRPTPSSLLLPVPAVGMSLAGVSGDERGDGESKGPGPGLGQGVTLEDRLRKSLEGLCGYRGNLGGDQEDADNEDADGVEEEDDNEEEAVEEKDEDGGDGDGDMHAKERGQVLHGSALWKRLANRRQPKGRCNTPSQHIARKYTEANNTSRTRLNHSSLTIIPH